eukprot:TRINITY_DN13668_c0_g1_i2.p1 TRINITY_DN13668_c0_g1~~TRINITY_DN13668_c0_g1_i2.p1  ORF type:complete len:487 (+),score=131.16 TRINITY_DN13668_c0_g1_i2:85-1545(+)
MLRPAAASAASRVLGFGRQGSAALYVRAFATMKMVDPRTGEVFNEITPMAAAEARAVVQDADQAFQQWKRVSPKDRVATLAAVAEKLRAKAPEAARLMNQEMGKPISQGEAEVNKCAYLVDWYAEHAPAMMEDTPHPPLPGFQKAYVTYRPLGVIISIMPWNFPFWQVIRMAVPTMMAGNAVVLKHAPNCWGSGLMIEELMKDIPGLPSGLFRHATVEPELISGMLEMPEVQGIALTGSERAGKAVATKAGELLKKCVVELGGSDPYIVLPDADLDAAASAVVTGRCLNTGQVCIAPKRVIVDKSVKGEFERLVLDHLAKKSYGKDFGPMVHAAGKAEVLGQVNASIASGAKLLAGGPDAPVPEGDSGTAFFAPTVLTDVKPGMVAFDQEIFGPVIAISEAASEAEALELANKSKFGLGGAVFTQDKEKGERIAADEIDAGMCFVNDFVRSDPSLPFGGVKTSGLGRECSIFGLREFMNVKTICVK